MFFGKGSVSGTNDLWKSDGTLAGTILVSADANISSGSTQLVFNGYLYFCGGPGNNQELWRSDGTTLGTAEYAAISAANSSEPTGFTIYNSELYFSAANTTRGLWKTDGISGAQSVQNVTGGLDPKNLSAANGILYFQGRENLIGRELWKSDGTTAGTVRVKDMSANNGDPILITPVNAANVVFQGGNVAGNIEIWKSDGTFAGTLIDLKNQLNGKFPSNNKNYRLELDDFHDAKYVLIDNSYYQIYNFLVKIGDKWVGEFPLEPDEYFFRFNVDGKIVTSSQFEVVTYNEAPNNRIVIKKNVFRDITSSVFNYKRRVK